MIFLFAGHSLNDPGAPGIDGVSEAELTMEFRNLILKELPSEQVIMDEDEYSLKQLIEKIHPGSGSVLLDCHFNSAGKTASGTEVIVADKANKDSRQFAAELVFTTTAILGIPNRGVKSEKETHRGRLGILHTPAGIAALSEIAFISNSADLERYHTNKQELARAYARILLSWDALRL
jgi:N-acetylmuramoyl-L-alanine amidase